MQRRSIAAAGVGAAVLLAGCATDREITTPEPEPVTQERVADALLTAEDLPEGYTAADGEATPFASEVVPEHECDDRLAELQPEESGSRSFTGGGTVLTHFVAWFPGQGGAVEQVFIDVANACDQVVAADQNLSIRTSSLDFGVLSDDTLAVQVQVEPTTGPIEERDVILRREGDLISVVRMTGPRPSNKRTLDTAVRVAIGHLGQLHADTT